MKKVVIAFLLYIVPLSIAHAVESEKEYIESFEESIFTFRPFLVRESFRFDIFTDNRETKISYEPNVQWKYGASMTIYDFGFYFVTDTNRSDWKKDEDEYGKTESMDLLLHYYTKGFGIDLFYQRYKGFYISNPEDHFSTWNDGDPYPQLPDMKSQSGGINFYYQIPIFGFGKYFSLEAAFDQTERQKKSTGSFMIMASAYYLGIDNSSSIIPPESEDDYDELRGLEAGKFYTLSLSPGFAYSLVLWKFSFTPAAFFGIGAQHQIFETGEGEKTSNRIALKINIRASLIFNGDNFLAGTTAFMDNTKTGYKGIEIEPYTLSWLIFIGVRF